MAQKTLGQETTRTRVGKHLKVTPPQAENSALENHEEWLYDNPQALAEVKRGLADSAAGRGVKKSFLEFADIDVDD